MPRKKLIISSEYPYHITARSNNKEWFYLSQKQCWEIFNSTLETISIRFCFRIHAFVLMNNHYHLMGTADEKHPLPKVMEWFQRSVNRTINDKAGRINHLFGGPYKACIVDSPTYYYHALKYVYRNPIVASMTNKAEDYDYSSLRTTLFHLSEPKYNIDELIPKNKNDFMIYLNKDYSKEAYEIVKKAIVKTRFRFTSRISKKVSLELRI